MGFNFAISEFNLGPLFLLENLADEIYRLRPRDYIYRRKENGALSSFYKRLADPVEGSSVTTYRSQQMERAHLPVTLWS